MKPLIDKLLEYKEKINRATTLDQNFENLIAIEIYDFIHESDILRSLFEQHALYLEQLPKETEFAKLQDTLLKTISPA